MIGRKTILVCFRADEQHQRLLRNCAQGAELIWLNETDDIPRELLERADAILGNPKPAVIKDARRLEWLQLASAGAEQYVSGVLPENACLTNASGAYGPSMAEYMVCAVMSLMMDFPSYRDHQKQHVWRNTRRMSHLAGTLALSVGFGDIGREFAKRYRALGGHVIGVKRTVGEIPDYVDELHPVEELDSLIPRADVVALSLPSTKDTSRLFDARRLALMKKSAYFVNVGRGKAVDTGALYSALVTGGIGGAAIDVTDPEPLPADSPLWDVPNLILTPHISGGWWVAENYERGFRIILENLERYLKGEPLDNRVNLQKGY